MLRFIILCVELVVFNKRKFATVYIRNPCNYKKRCVIACVVKFLDAPLKKGLNNCNAPLSNINHFTLLTEFIIFSHCKVLTVPVISLA